MTKQLKSPWVLAAAIAAVPLFAAIPDASAQYRIDTGNTNDASNRVGSGGRNPNDSAVRTGGVVSGNDIVTGNVTGGKEFRGHVPYQNTNQFRQRTGGEGLDNYIRSSSGVDGRLAERVEPYYGVGRTVEIPQGFQQVAPGTGAYVPAPVATGNALRPTADPRLGAVNLAEQTYVLPAPGELLMPGPVDPTAGQQYISASSLTGIRQMDPNDPGVLGTLTNTRYDPQTGQLTPLQIQRMQDELRSDWRPEGLPPRAPGAPGGAVTPSPFPEDESDTKQTIPGQTKRITNAEPVIQQRPGGVAERVVQKPVDTSVAPDGLSTNQGLRQRILPPPQQQSSLYAELWKRHQEAAGDEEMSDAEASRVFNAAQAQQKAQQGQAGGPPGVPGQPAGAARAPGRPGAGQPGAAPGGLAGPRGEPLPVPPPAGRQADPAEPRGVPGVTDFARRNEKILERDPGEKRAVVKKVPAPVKVPSLGKGIKSKGLTDIMSQAETLMKDGKFTAALDQYDQAEQVAPNNPLVNLGRANAELGASYYARADAHLREVFTKNPELLVGQYDLAAWLGEPRLQALVKDLKEISSRDVKEPRPVFLLAYIAYNTGNVQQAEAYLDLADRRSGGADPFYKLLRENWALPQKPAVAPDAAAPDAAAPDAAAPDAAAPATPPPPLNK